jgi:four helix bundle protein
MHNANNLQVRARAFALVVAVHKAVLRESARVGRRAPGLTAQLLRASASISSNIVEGADQRTATQFARYLAIAIASASETEHHLELALALDLFVEDGPHFLAEVREIRKMLHGLRKRVLDDAERATQRR